MKKILLIAVIALLCLVSCNDSFLEKYPKTSLVEETAFETYDNFKSYMWGCYDMFKDRTISTSFTRKGDYSTYRGDRYSGYLSLKNGYNPYAYQTVAEATSGNGWDFSYIRKVNLMLSHIEEGNDMKEDEKVHWKAVGLFFRSYWYMELIDRFGDVPWVEEVYDETSKEAYGTRTPRDEVAKHILDDLKWAEENIGDFSSLDGANTIDVNCVRMALSRYSLREGTWRKYHGLSDSDTYLMECKRVSKLLIDAFPTLYYGTDGQPAAGYGEMCTSPDLKEVPGIILYQEYVKDLITSPAGFNEQTSSSIAEMPQHMVDLYLCKDGKTITNSSLYAGDKDMYSTFRNRDPRMYHILIPPYLVQKGGGEYPTWSYTDNPADREYIDIMGANTTCSNPGVGMKRLPFQNWGASLLERVPNFVHGTSSTTKGYISCRSGYYVWKNACLWDENYNNKWLNVADKPIFKVEEAILNYAEAMVELGEFTQSVADESINRLRDRAGIGHLIVSDIDDSFAPTRPEDDNGNQIAPLTWEVRRERIIELMGEGFGIYDVRRWKCAHWFVNHQELGMWTSRDELKTNEGFVDLTTGLKDDNLTEGYIYLWSDPVKTEGKGWDHKYYLYQVPTDEIVLNPSLTQNPGY